ncbi:hypothetical protein [Streptomyces sp. NPDC005077]|uniref:hypothetical protein n=1 Tax=Streptomyces sp. NPDC005077 TaxID=3154292 RepID=UPI0033BEB16C
MDAGLAGLIGALGGATLGIAGAWGAAFISFGGARYQADKQGQTAHEQWLRQIRREAYAAFLSSASVALERVTGDDGLVQAVSRNRSADVQTILVALRGDIERLERAYGVVLLEAPATLSDTAHAFLSCLRGMETFARHVPEPEFHLRDARREADSLLQNLTLACRASLQDRNDDA